jgi:hypothetical protein
MGKVLFYRVDKDNSIRIDRSESIEGVTILEVLNFNSASSTDSIVFLNNKKTDDFTNTLKKGDLLFVFIKD